MGVTVKYSRTHEWVELEDSKTAIIGVSDRAQHLLGEIIFVELPEVGDEFEQDDPMGSIESSDGEVVNFYAPITGEIIEINESLESSPDLINRSPEGDGWLVKMRVEIPKELVLLMTPSQYEIYEEEDLDEDDEYEDEEEY
jgi:glycine cleavage system H protein